MKEHPILFSGPMVRALLAGTKTQTRRIVTQPRFVGPAMIHAGPYGGPGDRLWVRETFAETSGRVIYRESVPMGPGVWRPSIFMPRALSRITLEVVSVRVERLQDITDDDILAEGVTVAGVAALVGKQRSREPIACNLRGLWSLGWDAINGKRAPWASNPWVWRVEFRRLP